MFTDELRKSVWEIVRQRELAAFGSILTPQVMAQAAQRAQVKLGRGILNIATLLWLAIAAALRPGVNFCQVMHMTLRLLADTQALPQWALPQRQRASSSRKRGRGKGKGKRKGKAKSRGKGKDSRHDPRKGASDPTALSEEAFVQARRLMPQRFWVALILLLGEIFESRYGKLVRWNGFRLLALDGTCITLEHWQALGEHFGYARNQRGRRPVPQARLVMLQLPLVRLPWRFDLTGRWEGESTVAARLLRDIRRDDLVLMDRGFFHFGLFQQIADAGAYFAIRRIKQFGGARVRTIKRLADKDRLVLWTPASRKWKGASTTLRIIDYQIKGFRASAIVTNVLDEKRVSREQFLGLADSEAWRTERDAGLYHRRWEIETSFREMKCVQQMQGGLRGRTPETIRFEVAGHVLLYLLTRWLMVEAAVKHGVDSPLRLSFTEALAEVEYAATRLMPISPPRRWRALAEQMLDWIASHEVPFRPGRRYPRPNDGKVRYTGAGHRVLSARLAA